MSESKTAIIDCDSVSFKVAAACETSTVIVKHRDSKSSKEFKNKTEFLGRSKKTVGGYLGELNKSRSARGQREFGVDEFEITPHYVAQPLEAAIYSAKHMLKSYKQHLGITKSILLVGEGKTFRHSLPLPTVYKGDRQDTHKPILLDAVKDYFKGRSNTEVITGIEADDRLSHYMYAGHQNYLEKGFHNYIGVSIDKDNLQTYGELWNPSKDTADLWLYPEPRIIDGFGEIYRDDKGKVRGYGDIWLFFQILNGDDTDGYNPTKPFGIRCGEVTVYEILKDCKDISDALKATVEAYQDWFPQGVQYTSHCGRDMDLTPMEWCQIITDCAFMQRFKEDRFIISNLLDAHNITYDKRN